VQTKLYCWHRDTGKQAFVVAEASGQPPALAFSPDGKLLATAGNGGIVLRETTRGGEKRRLGGPGNVACLAFSPDGRTLAAGGTFAGRDGSYGVSVWELAAGGVRHEFLGHTGPVTCLAFSDDGRVLASGSVDTTVVLWDMTGRALAARRRPPRDDVLWTELGSARADQAFHAVSALVAAPDFAVKLLKEKMRPAENKGPSPEAIRKLIDELDAPQFAVRERASRALRGLGEAAGPALRERLAAPIPAELRRRVEVLLERLDRATLTAEELRARRAVEVLEYVGSPGARDLLAALGRGAPGAALTGQARTALRRLPKDRTP
jgi:hypothetical protein